jgi:PAS domain S-box-containing protein/putative nucleotidyltransferase with HDIG domain
VQDAPIPIAIHAEDGEFIQLNTAWEELSGYTRDRIPTMADWTEKAYGERAEPVRAEIERLYGLTERKDEGEFSIRTADGTLRIWDFSSAPLGQLPDGRRIVMTTARDVTARKAAEDELRESEERMRSNLEVSETVADLARALVAEKLSLEETAQRVLDRAMGLTRSEHGFVAHVDESSGDLVLLAASQMMPGGLAAAAPARGTVFPMQDDGSYEHLWGVSLNTGRAFLTNDPDADPQRGGTPMGHVPLTSFLSVPVVTVKGIVGQISVANAARGYTNVEVLSLERLASLYGVAIAQHEEHKLLHESEESLRASNERLETMILDVAEVMGGIIETRDPYTQGHQVRVARIAESIGAEMSLSEDDLACIHMAALLHDIGKLSVPAEILGKPGALSAAEFALIKEHPLRGHDILAKIAFPWPIAEVILQHHERCDGSGYPSGIECADMLVPARILAVADVLEAMSSFRPYRAALGPEIAIAEINGRPEKYCADVVKAALALYERGELGL